MRNKLEHGIDPFYSGNVEEVQNEFNINKQVEFVNMVLKLINMLPVTEMSIKKKSLEIDYNPISLEERKMIISNTSKKIIKIFEYITTLSYRPIENFAKIKKWIEFNKHKSNQEIKEYIEKTVTTEEEKKMIDLCMKTIELNRAMPFTYENKRSIKGSILNKDIDTYAYFCRISLLIIYQIFDKFGLYLKDKLPLECDKTYIKIVVDEINEKSLVVDEVIKEICDNRNSREYLELNKLRNFIEHKNGVINYHSQIAEISSLIVINYNNIVNLVEIIVKKYFTQNHIVISDMVRSEVSEKVFSQRL